MERDAQFSRFAVTSAILALAASIGGSSLDAATPLPQSAAGGRLLSF